MLVCWCVLTAECLSYLSSLGGVEIFKHPFRSYPSCKVHMHIQKLEKVT